MSSTRPFQEDLKTIVNCGCNDIPMELLDTIVEASGDTENRKVIMIFLRECFTEPSPQKHWRRVYAALVLAENLMQKGDPHLLIETSEGRHFDMVQQLSFLQHFNHSDRRVQKMVQAKASTFRTELLQNIQDAEHRQGTDVCSRDDVSTCADSVTSYNTMSTDASKKDGKQGSATSPACSQYKCPASNFLSKSKVVLNDIVAVGHNEDTTDDSSEDEANPTTVQHHLRAAHTLKLNYSEHVACHTDAHDQQTPAKSLESVNLLDL